VGFELSGLLQVVQIFNDDPAVLRRRAGRLRLRVLSPSFALARGMGPEVNL